jgi:hypothetical protein
MQISLNSSCTIHNIQDGVADYFVEPTDPEDA